MLNSKKNRQTYSMTDLKVMRERYGQEGLERIEKGMELLEHPDSAVLKRAHSPESPAFGKREKKFLQRLIRPLGEKKRKSHAVPGAYRFPYQESYAANTYLKSFDVKVGKEI